MLPVGFPMEMLDQPKLTGQRMASANTYRTPPLKMTLETIAEDNSDFENRNRFARSMSLPAQRRFSMDSNGGLQRFPNNCPGQDGCLAEEGEYFAGLGYQKGDGGFGVSMSGPVFSNPKEYGPRKHRKAWISIQRVRDAIKLSRFRGAFSQVLSRLRPTVRRSN